MNAPTALWEAWRTQVKLLFPHLHGHQQKALAWMVLGTVLSGSAVLQRMAEGLYGISAATMPSIERRLARFVANDRVNTSFVWNEFLAQVLPFWRERRVFLVLDCTPFDDRATIVYLGLLIHSRVLPLAWQVMPAQQKWPESQWEIVRRLLEQVAPHLERTDCTLVADQAGRSSNSVVSGSGIICCACAKSTPFDAGWAAGPPGDRWASSSPNQASSGAGVSRSGRTRRWRPI